MFKRKGIRPTPACLPIPVVRKQAGITAECFTGSDYMSVHRGLSMLVNDKFTVMRIQRKDINCFRSV